MRYPTQRMTPNTVIVYPASYTATDVDASPVRADGSGTTFAVAIQPTEPNRAEADGTVLGTDYYEVIFYADPLVSAPDQRIDWTADITGTFGSPILLLSLGGSVRPPGRCFQWIVRAVRRT